MNHSGLFSVLLGIFLTTSTYANSEPNFYRDDWTLDVSFGSGIDYNYRTVGFGHGFGLEFPLEGRLSYTQIKHPNASLDEKGKAIDFSSALTTWSFVVSASNPQKALIRGFSEIGIAYLVPDDNISEDSSTGLSFGFGLEVPANIANYNTDDTKPASMYLKASWLEGLDRASEKKIASEPDLFNGYSFNLGLRVYF